MNQQISRVMRFCSPDRSCHKRSESKTKVSGNPSGPWNCSRISANPWNNNETGRKLSFCALLPRLHSSCSRTSRYHSREASTRKLSLAILLRKYSCRKGTVSSIRRTRKARIW
jgi:hypothetical protein